MKLRNKKTGEIIEIDSIHFVFDDGYAPFSSLRILNAYWEDYKPAEPLIKDEKIRKAVRAWAELNITEVGINKISMIDGCTLSIGYNGPRFETWNDSYYGNLQRGKEYTIAELCGEEEE